MTPNSGRIQINLKPREQRHADATEIIRRLQTSLHSVDGITLYMQPVQDLTVENRVSRTQYQYTLEDADSRGAGGVDAAPHRQAQGVAGASRGGERSAERRAPGHARHRSRQRVAARHRAPAHRRHAVRRLRPAPGLDHLHPAEPVPRGPRGPARLPGESRRAQEHLREVGVGRAGASVLLHPLRAGHHAARHQSPGPVSRPSRCPSTSPPASPSATPSPPSRTPSDRSGCPLPSGRASRARPRPSRPRWPPSRCSSSPRSSPCTSSSACSTRATSIP